VEERFITAGAPLVGSKLIIPVIDFTSEKAKAEKPSPITINQYLFRKVDKKHRFFGALCKFKATIFLWNSLNFL
jgi:hypothetical protein